jgi:CheY-like chemotaxis protein
VYSLGCLLYHCLSGQVPFARDTDVAVIYAHLSEQPAKLEDIRPDLPHGLDAVVAKAMDKSPDRRFPSCGDMISAARAVLDLAGPLGDTTPPRQSTGFGAAISKPSTEVRDAAAAARRPRVLLGGLDDHTTAIARVALGNHVDVLEADPGATVDRAREERPDLVILDWAGAGGIADLRADAITRDAKVLLLVEHAQSASRDVAAAGADERLAAPFSPLQLQVKLRRLLGAEVLGG